MRTLRIISSDFLGLGIKLFPQRFFNIISAIIENIITFENITYTPQQLQDAAKAMYNTTADSSQGSKTDRDERDRQRIICNTILLTLSSEILARGMQASSGEE